MGIKKIENHQLLTQTYTNQTTSWFVHNLNIFGAKTSHRQTWTHKTHHDPHLGEATTFPFIVYSVSGHGTNIQMTFFLELPNGSPEIPKVGTFMILGPHNFLHKPLIDITFQAKL
jgi:hypothetical protein